MLYFTTREGIHMLVLTEDHIDYLKKGEMIKSPNNRVCVFYTPDDQWLGEKLIENMNNLTPELFDKLMAESQKRPVKRAGPFHPTMQIIKEGKLVKGDE